MYKNQFLYHFYEITTSVYIDVFLLILIIKFIISQSNVPLFWFPHTPFVIFYIFAPQFVSLYLIIFLHFIAAATSPKYNVLYLSVRSDKFSTVG